MKNDVQKSFVSKRTSSNTCFENYPKRILNHSKVPIGFSIFDQMRLVNYLYEIVWGYALVVDST